jgi:hypothetical protein
MFNKTFYHFLFGFIAILSLGFVVLVWAGHEQGQIPTNPVDNVALPQ